MHIFNSHIHTSNSKDCKITADEMCRSAQLKNLSGIAITDHCNLSSFISENAYQRIKLSVTQATRLKSEYADRLFVGVGVEIGNELLNPQYTKRILSLAEYDVILASVHVIDFEGKIVHLARTDFSKMTDAVLKKYIKRYFFELLEAANKCDFDILSHITLPVRYINGEYGRGININEYSHEIDAVLKAVILHDKAVEVNTSDAFRTGLMPDKEILLRYRELGGTKVTIGTDAHTADNLTHGFDIAIQCLKECGFTQYGYYDKRQYVNVPLN